MSKNNPPVKKFYAYILLDQLDKIKKIPGAISKHKEYGNQIQVKGAEWAEGNISITYWNKEAEDPKNSKINICTLRPDTMGGPDNDDSPF